MRQVCIGDAFAITEAQRFQLSAGKKLIKLMVRGLLERVANLGVAGAEPLCILCDCGELPAMLIADYKEPLKELCRFGPSFYREKVDDLNEELSLSLAGFADSLDQPFQPRQKTIMSNAKQRPTGNVAHAGGFDDQLRGPAYREAPVPVKIVLSDKSLLGRSPGDHGGHPGAARELQRAQLDRLKQQGLSGGCHRGPDAVRNRMLDWLCELPHVRLTLSVSEPRAVAT